MLAFVLKQPKRITARNILLLKYTMDTVKSIFDGSLFYVNHVHNSVSPNVEYEYHPLF